MRLAPIRLEVPAKLTRDFKRQAKEAFPIETVAYVLGRDAGTIAEAHELYIPDGVQECCTAHYFIPQPHWAIEAAAAAKDEGLCVLGTIHSHPYTFREIGNRKPDRTPSEGDHDSRLLHVGVGIYGICAVQQYENGKLRASIRFWGPTCHLDTQVT